MTIEHLKSMEALLPRIPMLTKLETKSRLEGSDHFDKTQVSRELDKSKVATNGSLVETSVLELYPQRRLIP